MAKRNRWDKTGRHPRKIVKEIRRACREQERELLERQNGTSHQVMKVAPGADKPGGIVVVPRGHGELPKGTYRSILKTLAGLGLTLLAIAAWLF